MAGHLSKLDKPILRISMIIPIVNELAHLEKLCAWQAWVDEYIIVDGGSTDGTVQQLAKRGVQCLQGALGRAEQMNTGASCSRADILWFVHADSDIDLTHITQIQQAMQQDEVVGGRFDVQLSGQHWALRMVAWMMNKRSRLTGIATGDQGLFVRRDVFEVMGGFPKQALMEDIEFSKALKKQGKTVQLTHKIITSSRRWEQLGIARTIVLMWKFRLLYWFGVSPEKLARMYLHVR